MYMAEPFLQQFQMQGNKFHGVFFHLLRKNYSCGDIPDC